MLVWWSAERQLGGKLRPATDPISDAAAHLDDYYHHPFPDDDDHDNDHDHHAAAHHNDFYHHPFQDDEDDLGLIFF